MKPTLTHLWTSLALAFAASANAGTITGRVVDERGEPIAHAEWAVTGYERPDGGLDFPSGSAHRGTTDENGRFAIDVRPQYRYDLHFDHFAHAPSFAFRVAHDATDLSVTLRKGHVVKGRVVRIDRDEQANKLRMDAVVTLMLPARGTWYHRELHTDAAGRFEYRIDSPPPFPDGRERRWQLRFAGETIELNESDLEGETEIVFELQVRARRTPREEESR